GSFVFYKTESRRDYEAKVNLKATCVNVKSGLECPTDVCPPESHPRENLLVVFLRDGNMLILCANSEDEALAWKLTLMEAKINPVSVLTYNPYDDTYQTIPINSHNAVYIMPSTGSGGNYTNTSFIL
uniref:PH domain-containing protein n=1 Tax=Sinocyclocheilus rhinocerous TaxID=307959 RepID=A0A673N6W3_9TELE